MILHALICLQPDNIYNFGATYFADLLSATSYPENTQEIPQFPGDDFGVQEVAGLIDVTKLSPGELEPIILGELIY